MITIDQKKCVKCRICEKECPSMAIDIDAFSVKFNCISCGHCVAVCPKQAVMYNNTSVKKLKPNSIKTSDLLNLFKNNRSIRFFMNKDVPGKILNELIAAVKFYPSSSNRRKTKITVITDKNKIKQINDLVSNDIITMLNILSNPFIQSCIKLFAGKKKAHLASAYLKYFIDKKQQNENFICMNAPALILFHSKGNSKSGDAQDSFIWASNTSNLALTLGVGCCFIGYITHIFNRRKFRKIKPGFDIPSSDRLHAVLAIGYSANKFVNEIDRPEQQFKIV